jgi:pyruvate,water dikinase
MVPDREDLARAVLPSDLAAKAPLSSRQVIEVCDLALRVETAFDRPQDVEWTVTGDGITLLQTRPITTRAGSDDNQRGWYLSLHKSYDQLVLLRQKIEEEHIPAMISEAQESNRIDLEALTTEALGWEIQRRWDVSQHWSAIYWSDFIPYAHGIRLFGQYYNDRVQPEDPYEFIDLLTRTGMQSLERNDRLQELAAMVRRDPGLVHRLSEKRDQNPFEAQLRDFLERFGDLASGVTGTRDTDAHLKPLLGLIQEMARQPAPVSASTVAGSPGDLKAKFLSRFTPDERPQAESMLDLARNSYQIRDDDNIHLGRIEACFLDALASGRRRLKRLTSEVERKVLEGILAKVGPQPDVRPGGQKTRGGPVQFRQRQLVGQPAGPGLVKARARVITDARQLMDFQSGEILVCDAVDPNMTFVVPLAAGIVERRGGMLIHGAIIAREYGLPCVTGAPQATVLIPNGATITVDGYLGIVTID